MNTLKSFQQQEIEQFHRRVDTNNNLFKEQAARLTVCVDASMEACTQARKIFSHAAEQLCGLAGQKVKVQRELVWNAASVMRTLRQLGANLKAETYSLRKHKVTSAAQNGHDPSNRQGPSKWMPVDTTFISLLYTTDLDVLREIREWQNILSNNKSGKKTTAKGKAGPKRKPHEAISYSDCMHGGIEGKYCRNPFTGSWGHRLDGIDGTAPLDFKLGGPSVDA